LQKKNQSKGKKSVRYGGSHLLIPTTQEAEIRRTAVQSQSREVVHKILSQKNPSQKRAGGVAEAVGPEFKLWYHKNK
jgi:hypothetical protein